MSAIQWVSVDPRTGRVIEELPGLQLNSSMTSIIGKGEKINVKLPVSDRIPRRWRAATEPNAALLVAHYADSAQTILWAGVVSSRQYGSEPFIYLGVQNVEQWLAAQYLPDQSYRQVDQASIMAGVGLNFAAQWFHGDVSLTATGVKRDRNYFGVDDKPRLNAMQDLMRVINGPEFTIAWRWEAGRAVCVPTCAQRLGKRSDPTFILSKADWSIVDDFTYGKGATIVVGSGERQADKRVQVRREATREINAGMLPFEYRFQPDTGSDKASIIANYVDQRLDDMRDGSRSVQIKAEIQDVVINRDLRLGDNIMIDLRNDELPAANLSMVTRMVGWTAEAAETTLGEITHITPILIDTEESDLGGEED